MRKILFVILSLLCLVVCSCNKEPQDLLTGTWDVSAKIISMSHLINGEDFDPEYCYVFERDGSGRRTRENMVTPFTYQYDGESQSIRFEMEGNQSIWYVGEKLYLSLRGG